MVCNKKKMAKSRGMLLKQVRQEKRNLLTKWQQENIVKQLISCTSPLPTQNKHKKTTPSPF